MTQSRTACIVGAGLVGSLWAILLRKRGYAVSLYEKRHDPRDAQADQGRSINLIITSRGLYGLERAGLVNEVFAITIPVLGRMVHPTVGGSKFQPYGRKDECNHSVSRIKLNNFLINAAEEAGVNLFFKHSLARADFKERQLLFSCDENEVNVSYNLLFGADGAGSEVRRELSSYFNEPGIEKTEWLEADYKELLMPAGPSGRFVLEKNALHIWPRGTHMLMGLPNTDGSFTMTLYLPKKGKLSFENVQTPGQIRSLFETEFPDAVPVLPDYVGEFQRHPQGSLGTVRCRRWVLSGSVALMGDAAHAMVPFFGQGMNCGFEDCTTMIDLMESYNEDWGKILPAYEQSRLADANAIADMALENWIEMRDKVGDSHFLLRKKIETWLEEQFPGVYKSRYGMVTYTLIPYSLAQKAGVIQNEILSTLCQNITSPEDIPKEKARALLEKEFVPFLRENRLKLDHYETKTGI